MNMLANHEKCVKQLTTRFQEQNIRCEDFEKVIGDKPIKRPDLWLPDFNTLIEVKTFEPQEREKQEENEINEELKREGKLRSAYWSLELYERFSGDLKDASRKFRNFPDYSTAVVFFDFHSRWHRQNPATLLMGQLCVSVPKVEEVYRKRSLRRDQNNETGAVVFHCADNEFKVFHNHFADQTRKISKDIFPPPQGKHSEFIDDCTNPVIRELG